MNTTFFAKEGQRGITETSATYICSIASQLKIKLEETLNNINFVNTDISIIGQSESNTSSVGITEDALNMIKSSLLKIADFNALIAWFSEARRAIEDARLELVETTFESWLGNNIPCVPKHPTRPVSISMSWAIDQMSSEERIKYLSLEAMSSTFGKIIHPDKAFESARKDLMFKISTPYKASGNGRDTIIYHYSPSVSVEKVDNCYFKLQQQYRSFEKELNYLKSKLREKINIENLRRESEYDAEYAKYQEELRDYNSRIASLQSDFNKWKISETERLSKIKFAIPESLANIVDEINRL